MYSHSPEPSWENFVAQFGDSIPSPSCMQERPLTATVLRSVLSKMRTASAAGLDGWRVAELRALPDSLLERLVELLSCVEQTGQWPQGVAEGVITLISKGEGASPENLRPISVMSTVYRLWAAARLREVIKWQEKWLASTAHGFRPHHGTDDVFWHLALQVERSMLEGTPLHGISLDYGKCFDRIPVHIVLNLASHLGLAPNIGRPLQGMYAQLVRRFRISTHMGTPFKSTNGILHGCPLSVILLNALVNVWSRA